MIITITIKIKITSITPNDSLDQFRTKTAHAVFLADGQGLPRKRDSCRVFQTLDTLLHCKQPSVVYMTCSRSKISRQYALLVKLFHELWTIPPFKVQTCPA